MDPMYIETPYIIMCIETPYITMYIETPYIYTCIILLGFKIHS